MELTPRFFKDSDQSYFIFGPRGTGKTTWLQNTLGNAVFVDLLDPSVHRIYSAAPERIRDLVAAQKPGTVVVIDEIQKLPELLDMVHLLIESDRNRRFVLTGSSSRKLKRSGVDLMAGRAIVKTLHPFMAAEMGSSFKLDRALTIGMVPLIANSVDPDETLKSYISLYLREEVKMEGLVRNIGTFSRFLETISFSHASVLNLAHVSRECQVERKTAEGYLSVLEDLLLAFQLPVFMKRAKRHLSAHPKFYYFDAGVFRSLRPKGPLDSPEEIGGAVIEGLVAQHLRAWNAYRGETSRLFFWRTKSGTEVDFIVYGPDTFCAIEVKNSAQLHPKTFTGLNAFKSDYPEADLFLVYRGKDRLKKGNVLCLPAESFLQGLDPARPIRYHSI
ncbi:MAG: ATP-binding protein [Syntrophaceae bacterium]|nr:ATP-binding protein [Syntrophaceae bacterium]